MKQEMRTSGIKRSPRHPGKYPGRTLPPNGPGLDILHLLQQSMQNKDRRRLFNRPKQWIIIFFHPFKLDVPSRAKAATGSHPQGNSKIGNSPINGTRKSVIIHFFLNLSSPLSTIISKINHMKKFVVEEIFPGRQSYTRRATTISERP